MTDASLVLGDSLHLRPLELADADSLHEIYREPQTMRFYGKPVCGTLDESRQLVGQMLQVQASGTGFRWAVLRTNDAVVVGSIGFHGWNRDRNCAFFSYEIVPQYRGQHLGVEAARLAIEFGAASMGLRRILAVIDVDNLASIATAERLGFIRESPFDSDLAMDRHNRWTFSLSIEGE